MNRTLIATVAAAMLVAPAAAAQAQVAPLAVAHASTTADRGHQPGWHLLAAVAGGPRAEEGVAAVGDKVFVIGGILADGITTTGRVDVYDTRKNTWSTAAPLPTPVNHPNISVVDGNIYLTGALAPIDGIWQAVPDSYVYIVKQNRWYKLPSMPAGTERGGSAVGVHGSTIYLAGGLTVMSMQAQHTVATVSAFDVVTRRWRTLPSLPQPRDHVGGAVVGDTFYVVGGREDGVSNVKGTVYALDLRTLSWSDRAPMPTPRGGLSSAVIGDKIYTFGGEGNPAPASNGVFSQVEAYNTATNRWQELAPMSIPRHGTAAVTVGGTIYIPGGSNASGGAPLAVNTSFTPRPGR